MEAADELVLDLRVLDDVCAARNGFIRVVLVMEKISGNVEFYLEELEERYVNEG